MIDEDNPPPFKNPPIRCCKCHQIKPHAEYVPKYGTKAVLEKLCRACRKGRFKKPMTSLELIRMHELGRIRTDQLRSKLQVRRALETERRSKAGRAIAETQWIESWEPLMASLSLAREHVRYRQKKYDEAGELACSVWCSEALEVIKAVKAYALRTRRVEGAPSYKMWWQLLGPEDFSAYKKLLARWPSTTIDCPLGLPNRQGGK